MARRRVTVFSLSFLDAITCGFGAVVLFFMIINASVGQRAGRMTHDLRAEVDRLEVEVLEGQRNLVEARNSLREIERETVIARGLSRRVLERLSEIEEELATFDQSTVARREHINKLKADLKSLDEENKRLSALAASDDTPGRSVRAFLGDGDRQYLTGLRLGGKRTVILADRSASMLGERLVNVLRRRNLADSDKVRARKWRQAVETVDWLLTQLPRESQFQLYTFADDAGPVLEGTGGSWLDAGDRATLDNAATAMARTVPDGGTNLYRAIEAVNALQGPRATQHRQRQRAPAAAPLPACGRAAPRLAARQRGSLPHGGRPSGVERLLAAGDAQPRLVSHPHSGLAMRKRRDRGGGEQFSLSFLDAICCGFGAIILLLVLTIEQASEELEGLVARLQEELFEIRGETRILNRDMVSKEEQLSQERERIARLQGDLSSIEGEYKASSQLSEVSEIVEGTLVAARQELSEEMERLLGRNYRRPEEDATIGGVPVDSEYIIFIIDTSGSMYTYAWPTMMRKMEEILEVYPRVKGVQVMNDMGQYMFSTYAGKWIPDTPGRRRVILQRLRGWQVFSNSSPVEGITRAIRTYANGRDKISLYVLGDEFTGSSIDDVVRSVDRLNRVDARGNRLVRIHAIGFPVMFTAGGVSDTTGVRFATLMRALCERNGGSFVGLSSLSR
jgi:hypothetical protein